MPDRTMAATTMAATTIEDASGGRVQFFDDFRGGFAHQGAGAPWDLRAVGPLPEGDGIVSTGPEGLVVVSSGTHERTGEPAFVPIPPGPTDILRWAAFARHEARTGFPGFDLPEPGLTIGATLAATIYGSGRHPFTDVTDATTDLRLGAAALIVIDRETRMVFDFVINNEWVIALYERLPGPEPGDASFSFAVPVARRRPDDVHDVAFAFDPTAGVARWLLGGTEVLAVDRIGLPHLDERYRLRGEGSSQLVTPTQLNAGLAVFAKGTWGGGARLAVRSLTVSTTPGPTDPGANRNADANVDSNANANAESED
jgi:hypothetical protein